MGKISFVRDFMQMDPEAIDNTANRFVELLTGLSESYYPDVFMGDALDRLCANEEKYGVSYCKTALWEEFTNYIECAVIDEVNHIIERDLLNLDAMDYSKFYDLVHIDINENSLDLIKMSAIFFTEGTKGTSYNYEVKEPKDLHLFVREVAQHISDVLQERNADRIEHETAVIQYLSENKNTADLLCMINIDASAYLSMKPKDWAEFMYDKLAEAVRNMTYEELEDQYLNIGASDSKSQKKEHEIEF